VLTKRLLDVVISGALLLLVAPVVLFILAAFALNMVLSVRDRGGVFYREPRISRGRTFGLLKFRTLRHDVLAEMQLVGGHARLYEADPANLTWVGRRILKPWYLDEIPQLWNVLLGEISLVGPRPWPPNMVAQQIAEGLTYRSEIPAGLTGPAQVTKGSKLRYADLDLTYVERLRTLGSLTLLRYDLGILWRTVAVIARGEGLSY
jgi:lipopolysaccharide/colanic/teichoic acid biosynthesis glycosyltransferase